MLIALIAIYLLNSAGVLTALSEENNTLSVLSLILIALLWLPLVVYILAYNAAKYLLT